MDLYNGFSVSANRNSIEITIRLIVELAEDHFVLPALSLFDLNQAETLVSSSFRALTKVQKWS